MSLRKTVPVHVAGDRSRKEAVITEGPIKGDVSSFLTEGTLFVCVPGVNAVSFLADTLKELRVSQAWEAFDMDKRCNPQVQAAFFRDGGKCSLHAQSCICGKSVGIFKSVYGKLRFCGRSN